jgi:SNF2 family DNA or RNA helicase
MSSDLLPPFADFAYHPHQREAIAWMLERETASDCCGGILADEMGLGKTWMTIGLILNSSRPVSLLLVPPVLQPQWCEALQRASITYSVLLPPTKTARVNWSYRVGDVADKHVYLCTYHRATHNLAAFEGLAFDRILCDEGHILRNGPKTRMFCRLRTLAAEAKWILSGTPVQNRQSDIRHLLEFLGATSHCKTRDVILRRTVGDVRDVITAMPTDKPVHIVHPVQFPPKSDEEAVFNSLVGRFEHAIETSARSNVILELYLRIRQFIAHPAIYVDAMRRKFKESYKREVWTGTTSKLDAFRELVGRLEAKPTLVFTNFRGEMYHTGLVLREAGYTVHQICGGMTDAGRERVVEESKAAAAAGKPVAIIVQIVAGGAGLNLQHCSRVLFYSSHWNPAVVDQAVARAYRMGQTERVEVHHLLLADDAEKNLDRYIAKLHGDKREVAIDVHEKLFCDSAIDESELREALDAVLPAVTAVAVAGAGREEEDYEEGDDCDEDPTDPHECEV